MSEEEEKFTNEKITLLPEDVTYFYEQLYDMAVALAMKDYEYAHPNYTKDPTSDRIPDMENVKYHISAMLTLIAAANTAPVNQYELLPPTSENEEEMPEADDEMTPVEKEQLAAHLKEQIEKYEQQKKNKDKGKGKQ